MVSFYVIYLFIDVDNYVVIELIGWFDFFYVFDDIVKRLVEVKVVGIDVGL